MQTPILPLPTIGAKAAAAPKVSLNANGQDNQFQRALSREMEQRQSANGSNAPTRTPERQPAAPAAPRPSGMPTRQAGAPAKQNPAPTARAADSSVQPGAKSAPPATTTSAAPATGKPADDDDADSAQSDAQAALDGPVADMLALVAAFNPPPAPATAALPAALTQAAPAALGTDAGAGAATTLPDAADATSAATVTDPALLQAGAGQAAGTEDFQATLTQAGAALAGAKADPAAAGPADAAASAAASAPAGGDATLAQLSTVDGAKADAGADGVGQHKPKAAPADNAAVQAGGERPAPDNAIPVTVAKAAPAETAAALKAATPAAPAPAAPPLAPAAVAGLEVAKAAAAAVPAERLPARVGTPGWDQQLGQKIVFMAAGGEQSATMELNPPDLGPVQVVLSISNDHATVAFSSAQPEVRQALEAAVPKLREMMGDAGIQLGNATVSAGMSNQDQGFQQQAASTQSGHGGGTGQGGSRFGRDSTEAAPRGAAPVRRLPAGAVDTFA
ncbi:flagellar hook-length control protein FliK [Rugamonas apoptosis]|uniref:Flagellar hook-length control protein FliK n=1 Tax=Rugamonas apoptosis TaxID=2758570 RepID=A0A7W2F790_9BURK|nr:flagellar hook-length control protein FliK [Rugamonas apoptosis]MBA5686426.1 flagellar hook-length control protein FliK [Rugamonas apoptosis]